MSNFSTYKYTRKTILSLIRGGKKTKDGHFWCPYVFDLIELMGDVSDKDYFYPRRMFGSKLYWTELEIEMFMARENLNLDINTVNVNAVKFYETNKNLINFELNMKLYKMNFTLAELIDCFEFKYGLS